MDHESLRTASTYLNNLLLARGLLRDSKAIDFVKPSKESRAQIINLVHDLILREDRDREQREHVALSVRQMRADETRYISEAQKLREKADESARVAEQARTAERVALAEAKKVDRAMKSLQDQTARLKTSLAQVKTQCANDVRKRDLELARLKTHLQGHQRGSKTAIVAPSIAVTGGARGRTGFDASSHDTADPEYSLKQETTEFLTKLGQDLSDENDSLINLIRGALDTMREVLGLSTNTSRKAHDSAIGSINSADDKQEMLHALPTSYETLESDMETALDTLKSILSNPNFVSVEEVEVREEEIVRLRDGWDFMEKRWKDVMVMMEGWRRRMDTGETINLDDLRRGMGMVSPGPGRYGLINTEPEESFVNDESISEIQLPEEKEDETSEMPSLPRVSSPIRKSSPKRKLDISEPPEFFDLRPNGKSSSDLNISTGQESEGDDAGVQLTVAEKLSRAQAEAEAAALAETEISMNETMSPVKSRAVAFTASTGFDGAGDEQDDTVGKMRSPGKKSKIRGRPKRRKSTLSPEELEDLINADD